MSGRYQVTLANGGRKVSSAKWTVVSIEFGCLLLRGKTKAVSEIEEITGPYKAFAPGEWREVTWITRRSTKKEAQT
jgi:hypothetical protein